MRNGSWRCNTPRASNRNSGPKSATIPVPLGEVRNVVARVAMRGTPVAIPHLDCHNHNPADPLFRALQPKACILAPLMVHTRTIGVLLAYHAREDATLTDSDKEIAAAFANQLAMALENAILYRRLENSERQYRGLVENAHEGIWIIAAVRNSLRPIQGKPGSGGDKSRPHGRPIWALQQVQTITFATL